MSKIHKYVIFGIVFTVDAIINIAILDNAYKFYISAATTTALIVTILTIVILFVASSIIFKLLFKYLKF